MSEDNSKKRLGRGLAALIGDLDQPMNETREKHGSVSEKGERTVPVEHIRANPNNPRKFFSDTELQDLTESIRKYGIVQPILVRPVKDEDLAGARYEIIAGERRWRAAQKATLHEVPILVRDVEDKQALELAIIENVQRADLNPVEEALGYQQLIDEYDYSQNDLAQVISKSRSHVANTLRLLKLPAGVQTMVSEGSLSAGHARTLVTADDPEGLARKIVSQGLSVRQAETIAQEASGAMSPVSDGSKSVSKEKSADTRAFESRIENALGLKVDLRLGKKETGEFRIKYKTLEQLEEVCRRLERW